MKYPPIRNLQISAIALSPLLLFGCSDTATFATGTSIGIAASANTQQAQIGYARAELFQGPNYPDVGDAPQVVGFLGSDLAVFSPHIRQLYATGDAANLVTAPTLQKCPSAGTATSDWPPNDCAVKAKDLNGERRILIFGTGTSVGLKFGFTGDAPSSINLGYDREELSVIPLHRQSPAAEYNLAAAENKVAAVGSKVAAETRPATVDSKPADKYSSVLASIDINVKTPSLLGADMQLTQFFATGAAARNLAKNPDIRDYFKHVAISVVNAKYVKDAADAIVRDQKDIDAYFRANTGKDFAAVRDKLLKDPQLANVYDSMPEGLKNASNAAAFDDALKADATDYEQIGEVARRLNPSGATTK